MPSALNSSGVRQSDPAGTLKLTAPYDLGATFLGSVIARFIALSPKVQVQAEFSSRGGRRRSRGIRRRNPW
jgi:DNA-binding transcriptional LysR family regulator